MVESAPLAVEQTTNFLQTLPPEIWFLTGSLLVILIVYLTKLKGGKK